MQLNSRGAAGSETSKTLPGGSITPMFRVVGFDVRPGNESPTSVLPSTGTVAHGREGAALGAHQQTSSRGTAITQQRSFLAEELQRGQWRRETGVEQGQYGTGDGMIPILPKLRVSRGSGIGSLVCETASCVEQHTKERSPFDWDPTLSASSP